MPLKDMKLKVEKTDGDGTIQSELDQPKFPHGLSLHLNEETIQNLELDKMPEIGKTMTIIANVNVEEIAERETSDGKKQRNINLQITEMSLEEKVEKDALKTLYGE